MNKAAPEDYIIATGKSIKLDHIVTKVFNHYKLKKIYYLKNSRILNRKLEAIKIEADINKLKKKLNISPKYLLTI